MAQIVFNHNPATFGAGASLSSLADYAVYWPLTLESFFTDLAGNNNLSDDGSSLQFNAWDGDGNTAASFDGFSYALAPDDPDLRATDKFTWAFWIKTSSTGVLFRKQDTAVEYSAEITAGGLVSFSASDGSDLTTAASTTAINDGAAHLVVLERDGDNLALSVYIDNNLEASEIMAGFYAGTGGFVLDPDGIIVMQMRGLGKWNRVLTSGERSALWSAGPAVVLSAP